MKKYYLGSDKGNPDLSGIDYICAFLNGDIRAVTRDNNLRERALKAYNLQQEEIKFLKSQLEQINNK